MREGKLLAAKGMAEIEDESMIELKERLTAEVGDAVRRLRIYDWHVTVATRLRDCVIASSSCCCTHSSIYLFQNGTLLYQLLLPHD